MIIRSTVLEDLDTVMDIYDKARLYMRENGNQNQWINGYPDRKLIIKDINSSNSYVCLEDGLIVGVFAFIRGTDPTYNKIYEGDWLNDKPYGVIHRIASVTHKKGVGSYCIDWCMDKCGNVKIDTHRDNAVMRNLLKKNGFTYCGIIYLEDGAERLAFQKSL